MVSGSRASPPVPVAQVPVATPVASVVAFPVEGCSVEGYLVELLPNLAGFPFSLTRWVGIPPVPGRSASTGFRGALKALDSNCTSVVRGRRIREFIPCEPTPSLNRCAGWTRRFEPGRFLVSHQFSNFRFPPESTFDSL